jgi:hypothetical protein
MVQPAAVPIKAGCATLLLDLLIRLLQTLLLAGVALGATAAAASAQEAASSFEALAGRVRVGQQVWVTDTTGREVRGTFERLSSDTLVLRADGVRSFAPSEVRRIRARDRDSVKNGTLAGLVVGAGMATAWCVSAIADDSAGVDARVECAEGFTVFPALGALAGLVVDAVIPGKMRVVYQAPSPHAASSASLTVRPSISAHKTGVAVSFAF